VPKDSNGDTPELERVKVGDSLYFEAVSLLTDEARLLDSGRLYEWLDLLADDIEYRVPVRVTVRRADGDGFVGAAAHLDEDIKSLRLRVRRILETGTAYAEEPPSRTRHHVSAITVDRAGEDMNVSSYLLLLRNRFGDTNYDIISAQRDDVWRRVDGQWKLARRVVLVDQANLGVSNMSIFL
jgi:3-phenylpropionate/cinnamic acid dioxygenase small subunit